MWRNKPERRERNLFVFQGECLGPHFGIVRTTWYDNGQIRHTGNKAAGQQDWVVNTAKFTAVVGTALREGATCLSTSIVILRNWAWRICDGFA